MPTWSPRVGASGEDAYRWGVNNLVNAETTAYSTPPTLAQVNAGSGLNQILAELKRQGGGAGLGYTSTANLLGVTFLNALKGGVDALRTSLGRGVFPWTVWPISNVLLLRDQHLYELRRALVEPVVVNASTAFYIQGQDLVDKTLEPPYPPLSAKTCTSGNYVYVDNGYYWIYVFMGQDRMNMSRVARSYLNFTVPAGISNASARLRLYVRRDVTSPYQDFTDYSVEVWKLNTAVAVPGSQAQIDAVWAAPRTHLVSINVGLLCPARELYYEVEFPLSGLSTGALTLLFANSGETAGQRPNRSPTLPHVENKIFEVNRLYNSVYARLIFD